MISIEIFLVPPDLEVTEKALRGFFKIDTVGGEFVLVKVIFEVRGSEALPVHHAAILLRSFRGCHRTKQCGRKIPDHLRLNR